ncbi:MAG: hypothetical protein NC412_04240 [Roseburia sp.]|nr:hypothetical protein [Roseburia sp.]MCM1278113.1 hypothetical protein [Robinsoniella sp.]
MKCLELPNEQMLLVPVKIEGLIVGKEGESLFYGDAAVNFKMLEHTTLGDQMQAVPLSGGKPLEPGIHLHWILPDSFTHGTRNAESGEASYPPVPDRWLVTRIVTREENQIEIFTSSKSFLVESNALLKKVSEENRGSSTFPVRGEDSLDYAYLGRSGELKSMEEAEEYLEELTAVGYGEPTFGAYYPGCRNVFGFYDALEDVEEGQVTYQISGWYSTPAQDPLYGINSEEEFEKKLKELYWILAKDTKEEEPSENNQAEEMEFCQGILCHGAICGMYWNGKNREYDTGIPIKNPRVAIGNSSQEAFAALLTAEEDEEGTEERLAGIFFGSQMEKWLEQDGVLESEETLHENTFDALYSEDKWILKRRSQQNEEKEAWELSWEIACKLDELNKSQHLFYGLEAELLEKEKSLYFSWYKYTADQKKEKGWVKEMKAVAEGIQELLKERKALIEKLADLKNAILEMPLYEKEMQIGAVQDKYQLMACPEERYYMPGEPVLLFAGEGMENTYNKSRDMGLTQDGKQLCRMSSQIIRQFTVNIEKYQIQETISLDFLSRYISKETSLPPIIKKLIQETMLLSTDWAGVLAAYILKSHGMPVMDSMFEHVKEAVKQMQQGPYQALLFQENVQKWAGELEFQGVFPSKAAFQYYVPPWNPLHMEWGINYTPDSDTVEENKDRLKKWQLEDLDYQLKGEIGYDRKSGGYRGRMLITPHFMDSLSEVIQKYLDQLEERKLPIGDELLELKEKSMEINMMSQRLNGFHEYFLMERIALQLPVECLWQQDADMEQVFSGFSGKQKAKCFENIENHVFSNPYMDGIFSPVRAGYGVITQLRLVDTFGRVKSICNESNYELQARAMACSENFREGKRDDKRIIFPPRIMQPVKIGASFLSVRDKEIEMNEALCTSPIIGWFVPDYMDGSLMVLNADGRPLGNFTTTVDRQMNYDVIWMNVPGDREKSQDKRYALPKEAKGELLTCLQEFYEEMKERVKEDSMALYDFVNYLCNEICGMNKPGGEWKKDLLHFTGRPLALVQAELCLKTKHKLSRRQTWQVGAENVSKQEESQWNIRFPVRLGQGKKKGDGLAGFFKHGEKTYHRFYTYDFDRIPKEGFMVQNNEITLSCLDEKGQNRYTLLMDPTLPVHILSGILPVKKVQLPSELVSASLGKLKQEMPVYPLLTGMEQIQAPFMQLSERTWSWVRVKEGCYIEEELEKQPSDTAFEIPYPIRLTEGWLKLSGG